MNTLYGYMDSDELMVEREIMSIDNDIAHLCESYYMAEREHELNIKDIELKAILMEGCTIDDLQIMYEEEQEENKKKKQGILAAIWQRICNIFKALLGKFDNIKLTDKQKEETITCVDLDKLEEVSTKTDDLLGKISDKIGMSKEELINDIKNAALIAMFTGVANSIISNVTKGFSELSNKIKNTLENSKKEYKVGDAFLRLNKLKEKFEQIKNKCQTIANKSENIKTEDGTNTNNSNGSDTNNSNDNDSNSNDSNSNKSSGNIFLDIANGVKNIAGTIIKAISKIINFILGKKDENEEPEDKKGENTSSNGSDENGEEPENKQDENTSSNGSNGSDEKEDENEEPEDKKGENTSSNGSSNGSNGSDEKVKKSKEAAENAANRKIKKYKDVANGTRSKIIKKMEELGIEKSNGNKYSFADIDKLLSKEDEELGKLTKDEDDGKRDNLATLFATARRISELNSKQPKGIFTESTDEVDSIYTSLFESLDNIETIDTIIENSNISFNNDVIDLFDDLIL